MLNAICFYRVARWLYLHHVPVLPKLITLLIFLIYNSKVPYQAVIGKGTKLGYGGIGVIIHPKAIIGSYCSIGQQVTIREQFALSGITYHRQPRTHIERCYCFRRYYHR